MICELLKGENLVGRRFGKRVVVAYTGLKKWPSGYSQKTWRVRCDCGNEDVEQGCNLKSGRANSCGCEVPEMTRKMRLTHGYTVNRVAHPIYGAWARMITRATNLNFKQSKDYVGRGIGVCRRWRKFENFLVDMGSTWQAGLSLERVDNDRGYEPANCKWATFVEQANNTRANVKLTFKGRTQTLSQWAREQGIIASTLSRRLKVGWGLEAALTLAPSFRPHNQRS